MDRKEQLEADNFVALTELALSVPPCDKGCHYRSRCGQQQLACIDFAVYVEPTILQDKIIGKLARSSSPREPSRQLFKRIFFSSLPWSKANDPD